MQFVTAIKVTIKAVEVVFTIAIKGATEAVRFSVVNTGRSYSQAHAPITNISPDKGPGGKGQLQDENHIINLS